MRPPACLGKVPTHRDFVRVRASTPTMRAFDKWLRKGLHHVRNHGGDQWQDRYDIAPTRRFVFCGAGRKSPNLLLGVLRASRDATGRAYPFIIACEIPKHGLRPRNAVQLPVQARSFYNSAEDLVEMATLGELDLGRVRARVDVLEGVSFSRTIPHRQKQYLRKTTTATLSERLFGHFQNSGKYRLFNNLHQALSSSRTHGSDETDRGLLFPLKDGDGAVGHVVSFWSEVVVRLIGDSAALPTLFWSGAEEASSKDLLLFVGEPPPEAFLDTVVPGCSTDRVVQLQNDGGETGAEAALSIPSEYGELLEQGDLRLQDFLRQL